MANGDLDITTLIIAICVIIPAVIAISVCVILVYSYRNKDQISLPDRYYPSRERIPQDNHVIDFPRVNRYHQQRRLRGPPPVLEQRPPSYNTSVHQTKRQQLPLFSPVRTTPSTVCVQRTLPVMTPSIYSTMPPSYAEIFLTPHTLTNR